MHGCMCGEVGQVRKAINVPADLLTHDTSEGHKALVDLLDITNAFCPSMMYVVWTVD